MSDFRAVFTAGVTLQPWTDPADIGADKPSRINARPEHEHRRHVGTRGVQIEISAIVGGVTGPLDGTLGGDLFGATFLELPLLPPPAFSSPGSQSSVQRFTPNSTGHYTVQLARPNHGAVIVHIDVDS